MNINEDIKAKEVRLVKEDGEQMGVVDIETAMKAARDENLDLVELVPEAKPPVCKIMDYKHFLYDQKQKAKEAKKNQKQTQLKEMKLRPSTEEADYQVKLRKIISFLENQDKVKISIRFRGREMAHTQASKPILDDFAAQLADIAVVEKPAKMEGRFMTMFLTEKR